MIFDTHCHLNSTPLYEDIENVIKRAKAEGVNKLLVVGFDKNSSLLAVKIAQKHDICYAAIGVYPCEVYNLSDKDYEDIFSYVNDKKVIAIGEIGLDYHWEKDDNKKEIQKQAFIKQIEIANKYNLPVSIHCREATQDCYEILKAHPVNKKGIMHCFAGSKEMANEFIKLGFYIALGGTLTFTNSKNPKDVAFFTPLSNLVVETDSPYLAPHPYRGKTNEPALISLVVKEIANIKNIDIKTVENELYKNSCKILLNDEKNN